VIFNPINMQKKETTRTLGSRSLTGGIRRKGRIVILTYTTIKGMYFPLLGGRVRGEWGKGKTSDPAVIRKNVRPESQEGEEKRGGRFPFGLGGWLPFGDKG